MIDKIIDKTKELVDETKKPVKQCIIKIMRDELSAGFAQHLREVQMTMNEYVEYVYDIMKQRGLV